MLQIRHSAAALVLAALAGTALAAPGTLKLRSAPVDLSSLPNAVADQAAGRPGQLARRSVIQLDGPMTPDRRAALAAAGVQLGEYIPDFAYLADLSGTDAASLRRLGFVEFAGPYRSAWKLGPELGTRPVFTEERLELRRRGLLAMDVYLFPGSPLQETMRAIAAVPGLTPVAEDWDGAQVFVTVTAPLGAARQLAMIDEVQWVETTPEVMLRNATVRGIVQSGSSSSTPVYDAGITGAGQLIAVMDGRTDITHCSFTDPEGDPVGDNHRKVQWYGPSQTGFDTHGTHVAGTALGDGGSTNDTRGVAYDARLVFNEPPNSFTQTKMLSRLNNHAGQGAFIHTNSWGNDGTTQYDGMSRAIDSFSFASDDHLVIFAVTNTSTLKNPENAKNCLAVGATSDNNGINNHCTGGRGPTIDGRRKPEIYGPGCGIRSSLVNSSCSTTSLSGTSMAAPGIAGAAALVRQYFEDGYYPSGSATPADGFAPSGPLVKAMLLNATVDMTGVAGYPSDTEGWGRVLLDNALHFSGDTRSTVVHEARNNSAGSLATGQMHEMVVTVNSATEPLKVTLVFHDAPGAVSSNPSAINDLDLEVEVLGIAFKGNVFSGGQSTSGGSADPDNNVEMVLINSPAPGDYTIRVKATAVNVDSQGFAVVVSGDVDAVTGGPCSDADLAEPFGVLDFFDVSDFLGQYDAGACTGPAGDYNGDGACDFFDVSDFLADYNAGCS